MLDLFLDSQFYSLVYSYGSTTIFHYSSFLIGFEIKFKFCNFILFQDSFGFSGSLDFRIRLATSVKKQHGFLQGLYLICLFNDVCSFQVQLLHFFFKNFFLSILFCLMLQYIEMFLNFHLMLLMFLHQFIASMQRKYS